MPLDLDALLSKVRVQQRISSPKAASKARIDQRTAADLATEAHAKALAKRESLSRALNSLDIDAMRFRWIAAHSDHFARLAGQTIEEMRKSIDLWIKQEAIRRLSEMRRQA